MKKFNNIFVSFLTSGLLFFVISFFVYICGAYTFRNDPLSAKNIINSVSEDKPLTNYIMELENIDPELYEVESFDFVNQYQTNVSFVQAVKHDNSLPRLEYNGQNSPISSISTGKADKNGNNYCHSIFTSSENKFIDFDYDTTSIYLNIVYAYNIFDEETIRNVYVNNPVVYINFGDDDNLLTGNFTNCVFDDESNPTRETTSSYVYFDENSGGEFYNTKWFGKIDSTECVLNFTAENPSLEVGKGVCEYLVGGKLVKRFEYSYNKENKSIFPSDNTDKSLDFDFTFGSSRKFIVKGFIGYGGDKIEETLKDAIGTSFCMISEKVYPTFNLKKSYYLHFGDYSYWNISAIDYVIKNNIVSRVSFPGNSETQQLLASKFAPYVKYFNSTTHIIVSVAYAIVLLISIFLVLLFSYDGTLFVPIYTKKKYKFIINFIVYFVFFLLCTFLVKTINNTMFLNLRITTISQASIFINFLLLIIFSFISIFAKDRTRRTKKTTSVELDKSEPFDVPVCLMFFLRSDKAIQIIDVIRKVKPTKIYLLSDGPRNDEEKVTVKLVRKKIEKAIDWKTKIVKIYNEKNVGVCENIGGGALKVFSKENEAIFLEDDNLPSVSFFYYCRTMLEHFKSNPNVLWINGTNYLADDMGMNNYAFFTQQLLPCGWASWKDKFINAYDKDLKTFNDKSSLKNFKKSYHDARLYRQEFRNIEKEHERIANGEKASSWDYQMAYSLRSKNMYGIAPSVNLINNIGVDEVSIHGGTTDLNIMTKRFCNVPNFELSYKIEIPSNISIDTEFEYRNGNLILYPIKQRFLNYVKRFTKKVFGEKALKKLLAMKEKTKDDK